MSCNERKELLSLHAAGALEGRERAELLEHLDSGCPRCAGELAEARALLSHLPLTLDPVAPSAAVRERLLRRIDDDAGAAEPAVRPQEVPRVPARSWLQPLLAAAAAAVVTFLLVAEPMRREQDLLRREIARQSDEIGRLQATVSEASRLVQILRSPEMLMVSLAGTDNQADASGRILWDRDADYWHLSVRGMKPAPAGKTYQLWYVTADEEKISAGTFDVDAEGAATALIKLPEGIGTIVLAAATDEPAGGSPQPTGSFQLLGNVPLNKT